MARARSVGLSLTLAALVATVVATLAWAQAAPVELRPRWKAGDTRAFELVRHREQTRGTTPGRRVTTRSSVDVRVLSADADASVVEWKVGEVRVDGPEAIKGDPGVAELLGMGHHVRYELEVDASGSIRRLRNWTEVRDLARGATTRLLNQLRSRGVSAQVRAAISARVDALYHSEQQILGYSLKEVSLYHAALGKRLEPSVPLRGSERLGNPLGGEPLPSDSSLMLVRLEGTPPMAVIEWTQVLEPEATRRIMIKTLTDLATRMRRPPPTEDQVPDMRVDGTGEIVVEQETGWLSSLRMERKARLGPGAQIDGSSLSERK